MPRDVDAYMRAEIEGPTDAQRAYIDRMTTPDPARKRVDPSVVADLKAKVTANRAREHKE